MKSCQRGQTSIEYALLFLVVATIVSSVWNSPVFQDILGPTGSLFARYRDAIEYSYRHGIQGMTQEGNDLNPTDYNAPNHPSYKGDGQTRFFGHAEGYPD